MPLDDSRTHPAADSAATADADEAASALMPVEGDAWRSGDSGNGGGSVAAAADAGRMLFEGGDVDAVVDGASPLRLQVRSWPELNVGAGLAGLRTCLQGAVKNRNAHVT